MNYLDLKDSNLYLFLASGVFDDIGFWFIGTKKTDHTILDDKDLIECHRKELIGIELCIDFSKVRSTTCFGLISPIFK